jgi:tRNA G10  N-methylase Trm11
MKERSKTPFEYTTTGPAKRYTHYLFRYPAKFHPPIARTLLQRYTDPGAHVLDCFCGSGTLLVEAALSGRNAVGSDVDPVAAFVSRVKASPINATRLAKRWTELDQQLRPLARTEKRYHSLQWHDISERTYGREVAGLAVPAIPKLFHWFRRYVVVDLARIKREIMALKATKAERALFLLCFASIIRNCSNADPVPVSGLEVTSQMKKRDQAGRIIDPFDHFRRAVARAVDRMAEYHDAVGDDVSISVIRADATTVASKLNRRVDAVITSPPYHGAVDYYRRHQLEMFWLDFTRSQDDRLALLDHYIGRLRVPARDPLLNRSGENSGSPLEDEMRAVDRTRANGFRHYRLAMHLVFEQLSKVLAPGAPAAFVVGHSAWNGSQLDTSELFQELSAPWFEPVEYYSYPVKNRYMSYSRHNGASIDREYVLVFARRPR